MTLRRIENKDLEMMLSWRNHPSVRLSMFSQNVIEMGQHKVWFERVSSQVDSEWLLYLNAEGKPAGVVYYTDRDGKAKHAFWGFYTAPEAPSGTGTAMATEALEYFFIDVGLHKLNAEVLESNTRSHGFHRKLGFQVEGEFKDHYLGPDGYETITRFGLIDHDWISHKG